MPCSLSLLFIITVFPSLSLLLFILFQSPLTLFGILPHPCFPLSFLHFLSLRSFICNSYSFSLRFWPSLVSSPLIVPFCSFFFSPSLALHFSHLSHALPPSPHSFSFFLFHLSFFSFFHIPNLPRRSVDCLKNAFVSLFFLHFAALDLRFPLREVCKRRGGVTVCSFLHCLSSLLYFLFNLECWSRKL